MPLLSDKKLPSFKSHAAIWTLKSAGVSDAEKGLTNNASKSINAVLRRLQQWKQVPADVIVTSLYHLCVFYHHEIERSVHQCGQWSVKDECNYLKREPSLIPYMDVAPNPEDIVEVVHKGIAVTMQVDDVSSLSGSVPSDSEAILAHAALANQSVKLVEDGSWVVTESDRLSACAVQLFPKETCSCASSHYGLSVDVGSICGSSGKSNLSEMKRKDQQKKERLAGKKRPHKCDFAEPLGQNKQAKSK